MLSKTHAEESSIKTVTLARGSYSGSSPVSGGLSGRKSSGDHSTLARLSPEAERDTSRLLSQIPIFELLDNDPRPTLVVDLADPLNWVHGPLQIPFANSSLRLNPALFDLVCSGGSKHSEFAPPTSDPARGFRQFKTWILSAALNGEALEPSLPLAPFIHGGVSWSCYTMRKRFRVASASPSFSAPPSYAATEPPDSNSMVRSPFRPDSHMIHQSPAHASELREGHADYFGPATVPPETIVETVEPTQPMAESPDTTSNGARDLSIALPASTLDVLTSIDTFSTTAEIGFFDWTRLPLTDNMPRHIRFARSVDWASTKLGPIEFWSSDLRQMCNLVMASPHPAAMYWGEDLVAIYNEAYVQLAGQKHPRLMGQMYREAWPEIWESVKDVFLNARLTGQATMKDDDRLFMNRSHYLEETYFSWSIIPMVGGDGAVTGLYNPAFEKTRRKIAERRMHTLREVGERTATARDVKAFWKEVVDALDSNKYDTPFVLVYSVCDEFDSDSSSMHSNSLMGTKQCVLENALGVPEGHVCAPSQIDLKTGTEGFGPVFREAMKGDRPLLLRVTDLQDENFGLEGDDETADPYPVSDPVLEIPYSMLEGIHWRGFPDPCRAVVVCPVHLTTGDSILGFLVIGVNPRRPYDDDYILFLQLLTRQLGTSLASVVLFEDEIRRGQKAARLAALDRFELSRQLAARTQEARDSETRFTRMAEFSPAGLFIADSQGHITYCNDTWYEITRVPKDSVSTDRWIEAVSEEDQPRVRLLWQELVEQCKPVTAEFRFKAQWDNSHGHRSDTWVLFSAYPERDTDSEVLYGSESGLKSVFGNLTNISEQKWAEGFQKRKMEEAVELKRQQENFIDITSHEMRNPLSAILQCADEILTTLNEFVASGNAHMDSDLVTSNIDAAQTIIFCAQHQKRIVDDVLTLSKLDSHMLMVTPVDVQPKAVVQRALKMFENEMQSADIEIRFFVHESVAELGVDWVKLDPQRVLQVLINLTTNAIKFTTTEKRRTIAVTLAASHERPSFDPNRPVDYFPSRRPNGAEGLLTASDWGDGEIVYVSFSVSDTGRGLTDAEKKTLFLRFSQASPRTHVQYGGSGLGLFISRELTELQGGEIGVSSEAGRGSTFAFYVAARHATNPPGAEGGVFPGLDRGLGTTKKRKEKEKEKEKGKGKEKEKEEEMEKEREKAITVVASPVESSKTTPETSVEGKKPVEVLVVEDNLVNQRVLQKQLSRVGYVVHVANHGGECLDLLRRSNWWHRGAEPDEPPRETSTPDPIDSSVARSPVLHSSALSSPSTSSTSSSPSAKTPAGLLNLGVVLMDQEMPVMDGLACTRKIREWEKEGVLRGHVPIIAVTANAREEQIKALVEVGMNDVVSKPFRIPELLPKIEELLKKTEKTRPRMEVKEGTEGVEVDRSTQQLKGGVQGDRPSEVLMEGLDVVKEQEVKQDAKEEMEKDAKEKLKEHVKEEVKEHQGPQRQHTGGDEGRAK
ncbi:hypothetical protein EJ06DRAFT_555515 [Trichodelitschia bisporula]|uniref:Uncharacterized protein n=1 Tax=Trichodelitschia bisporula TaxID=703511 RepID=A0A6G1I0Q6_9PEZI|nr:hypothetical protein EJ06DRAFT_555515 [Trichodelitschia bisporula]